MTTTTPALSQYYLDAAMKEANKIATAPTSNVGGNEFVFFAAFDGTNNGANTATDGSQDSQTTAVQQLFAQVHISGNTGGFYEPGVGTPDTVATSAGNPAAVTLQSVITAQAMYNQFAFQAAKWRAAGNKGPITSMITSFSRGGAAAAIFAQMLYENGLVTKAGQVLIPPGTVGAVSNALILDPVLTGEYVDNLQFPPNVQNLTIIRAQNEYRDNFEAADYTGDNANIISVLGNHGDIGNAYGNDFDNFQEEPVDNNLGGLYLGAYTSFFQKAGLNIVSEPTGRAYNPDFSTVVHSESETTLLGLAEHPWDSTYNTIPINSP